MPTFTDASFSSLEQFHIPPTISSAPPTAALQSSNNNDTEMTSLSANLDQQPSVPPPMQEMSSPATALIEEEISIEDRSYIDNGLMDCCVPTAHRIPDEDVDVAVLSEISCDLPTYKSQVGEELDGLPVAIATALGSIQRAHVQRVIGTSSSASSSTMSVLSSSWEALSQVVEEKELEEHLRQCAQEARLRFEAAERQLQALQRAKLERRESVSSGIAISAAGRNVVMEYEVAQQLQRQMIYQDEKESKQQAATLLADRRMAEQLQQQSFQFPSAKEPTSNKMVEKQTSYSMLASSSSRNNKRRNPFRDLSRNLVHTRSTASTKPRRTIQTNQSEELWI